MVGQGDQADAPYIDHPIRVAAKMHDEVGKIVALLHDVIEDTPASGAPSAETTCVPRSATWSRTRSSP